MIYTTQMARVQYFWKQSVLLSLPFVWNKGCEAFVTRRFQTWKKDIQRFQEHERSSAHLRPNLQWQEGLKSTCSVVQLISVHHKAEVQKNREYLKILCESLLCFAKQGLAIRGHKKNDSSQNQGNFIELLKLRSSDNKLH